jgi:hypothetical protein
MDREPLDEEEWDDDWGGKILWPQQQVDEHEETQWEDLE